MSRAYLVNDTPDAKDYVVGHDDPLIVFPRTVARTNVDGEGQVTVEWTNTPVALREFTVSSPVPMPNTCVVPPSGIYGRDADGEMHQVFSAPERLEYDEILAEIGVTEVIEGDPPSPPAPEWPKVIGAVPAVADLPEDFRPGGVYLVRENGTGYCNGGAGEGWQSMRWTPECAEAFGIAEADVPDLTVG